MSNLGLSVACKKYGFRHHAAKVGDRYVLEDMQRLGAVLGGEDSGHMIFLDHHTTGDGILTALQLVAAMLKAGKPLSELAKLMDVFPQKLINVDVKSKPDIATVPEIVAAIGAGGGRAGRAGPRAGALLGHAEHVPGHGRRPHGRRDREARTHPRRCRSVGDRLDGQGWRRPSPLRAGWSPTWSGGVP